LLQPISNQELAEVLKWPFYVGEAEKLVLSELERKLSQEFQCPITFGGDLENMSRRLLRRGSRTSTPQPSVRGSKTF
jgi:hypothetical protein